MNCAGCEKGNLRGLCSACRAVMPKQDNLFKQLRELSATPNDEAIWEHVFELSHILNHSQLNDGEERLIVMSEDGTEIRAIYAGPKEDIEHLKKRLRPRKQSKIKY